MFLNSFLFVINFFIYILFPKTHEKYDLKYFTKSIIPWTQDIKKKCYYCPRLKKEVINKKSSQVDDDFKVKFPRDFDAPNAKIKKGGDMLINVFK
jgi:thioredoxin-related protein